MRKILLLIFLLSYIGINAQEKQDSVKTERLLPVIITNLSDFANDKSTPVSLSTLPAKEIELKAGNQSLPSVLLGLPSVYVTQQGGGYGDDRINIRGFDQRYIAVLINGVPVNDMVSGWVYWSNWMNLTDIASSVQVQRGLSTVKLAVPAVGGSINIFTKSAEKTQNGILGYEYGSEGYHKFSAGYNTGILDNGLAASFLLSYSQGDGYVDQTQMEAYAYFFNLEYLPNEKHRFMFTLFGSPQWHNQHNNASPLIDYINYGGSFEKPNIKYNSEWGYLQGEAYTWSRNYFHKPVAILNWDYEIDSSLQLTTALYGAWGRGGGSGPIGAINYQYPNSSVFKDENGQVRFDDIYIWNSGGNVPDFGPSRTPSNGLFINDISNGLTRYGFINNHSWYGSVINLSKEFSPDFTMNLGLDVRITNSNSGLAVNDVLGADAYYDNFDINHPDRLIFPKDFIDLNPDWNAFKSIRDIEKIVFYNSSNIRWFGNYMQVNWKNDKFKTFLQAGISDQQYQRVDYFNLPPDKQKSGWVSIWGGNIKAGANYFLTGEQTIYINGGYFSKQPLFKAVFPNYNNNEVADNIKNEKISSFEMGYKYNSGKYHLSFGIYQTLWKDRFEMANDFINNQNVSGRMYGIEELHRGIETEASLNVDKRIKINTAMSLGDWKYNKDVKGVKLYNFQRQEVAVKDYYLKDVKVGDAPQFTASYAVYYKPALKWQFYLEQVFIDKLYAKINADSFSDPNHKGSLQLPAYSVINTGLSFNTELKNIGKAYFTFGIKNLMDKIYISESQTNYFPDRNSLTWKGVNTQNRVFFGWGRTYNFSMKLKF